MRRMGPEYPINLEPSIQSHGKSGESSKEIGLLNLIANLVVHGENAASLRRFVPLIINPIYTLYIYIYSGYILGTSPWTKGLQHGGPKPATPGLQTQLCCFVRVLEPPTCVSHMNIMSHPGWLIPGSENYWRTSWETSTMVVSCQP